MSLPGKPVIRNAPRASPNTLEYYWFPPANTGGNPIEGYQLSLDPGGITCNIPASQLAPSYGYYKVTGLTNATTYFTTIAASTINGYGPTANFRAFQPGSSPTSGVSTTSIVASGVTSLLLSWTPPVATPDAQIFWYTINLFSTNTSNPKRYTGNALKQSNYFITGLNSNLTYRATINAVNCPGYSPQVSTATLKLIYPFIPTTAPNLSLWVDAGDSTTITASGGNVSQWSDKSGNAYTLTQGTGASQPAFATSTITFSGDKYLNIPQASINNTSSFCYFFVFSPTSATNWITVKDYAAVNVYNTLSMTRYNDATGANAAGTNQYLYVHSLNSGTIANSGTALTLSTRQIITMGYDGSTITIFRNGTQLTATAGTFAIQNQTSASSFTMGAWFKGGTIQNSGTTNFGMNEFGFYSSNPTPFNRQKVEGYLAWKWGLTGSLPTIHPFKTVTPSNISVFGPKSFSGLQIWYDASDPLGTGVLPANNSGVGTIYDKSGNTKNATGGGATFRLNTVNGLPILDFNSTQYNITYASFPLSYTIFCVFNTVAGTGNYQRLLTSALDQRFFMGTGGGQNVATFTGTTSSWNDVNDNSPAVSTANSFVVLSFTNNNTTLAPYANGSAQNTKNGSTTQFSDFNFGAIGGGQYYRGYFAELLIYNYVFTLSDIQTVEGYLAWKWGQQGKLPATHPYKNNNPGAVS